MSQPTYISTDFRGSSEVEALAAVLQELLVAAEEVSCPVPVERCVPGCAPLIQKHCSDEAQLLREEPAFLVVPWICMKLSYVLVECNNPCIYLHIYIIIYLCIQRYTCTGICMYIHADMYICIYMYIHTYIHTYIRLYTSICIYTCKYIHVYVFIFTFTHIYCI